MHLLVHAPSPVGIGRCTTADLLEHCPNRQLGTSASCPAIMLVAAPSTSRALGPGGLLSLPGQGCKAPVNTRQGRSTRRAAQRQPSGRTGTGKLVSLAAAPLSTVCVMRELG